MRDAQCQEGEVLGYPPPNDFIPNKDPVINKLDLEEPANPTLIRGKTEEEELAQSKVWFKQDDSFNQPFVWARVRLLTTDCDFSRTPKSLIFFSLWNHLMKECMREENYMSGLAGSSLITLQFPDYFGFQLVCYNFSHKIVIDKLFKQVYSFQPTEQYFNSTKNIFVRSLSNKELGEPYELIEELKGRILLTRPMTTEQLVNAIKSMSFEEFN
jgi:secreted Zn-dependent insulinase-like peptidase